MRCNSNCSSNQNSCNRRNNNGGNFQPCNNQPMNCGYNNGFQGMCKRPIVPQNKCNVFAAATTAAQTLTPATGATPTPSTLLIDTVLYNYGCAIQSNNGSSTIRITEPGIYQVYYFANVTNTSTAATTITTSLLRNSTQFATDTSAALAEGESEILSAQDIIYVSCQDIPLTVTLRALNPVATATITYEYFITINKICTCSDATSGAVGANYCCNNNGFPYNGCGCGCGYGYGYGCGCDSYYNNFTSAPMMPVNENNIPNFGGSGCNSSCGNNYNSSCCNNGCGCNS